MDFDHSPTNSSSSELSISNFKSASSSDVSEASNDFRSLKSSDADHCNSDRDGKSAEMSINQNSDDENDDETTGLLRTSQRLYGQVNVNYQDNPLEQSIEVEVVDTLTKGTQGSIITIFSMWNTMMGTSLLSMPWAIKQAGFTNGIVLLIVMAGLMAYTSYRVITSGRYIVDTVISEFSDVVRIYLGRFAEAVALMCSVLTLVGGAIVYWILMSNFLYHIVLFIYGNIHHDTTNSTSSGPYDDLVCQGDNSSSSIDIPESFKKVWDETLTVPLFLCILVFPLINFKSPTFFTKFNALGTLSVTYLIVFVSVKAGKWGFHLNFKDSTKPDFAEEFELSFPALTGVAALAYFLQNAVMAIIRNQKNPENNTRDLVIAYVLVCFTYTFMGAMFYSAFPLDKSCIGDNLLNNMTSTDVMSFVARVGLFFQMTCVLPLIIYVMRTQLLQFLFKSIWPRLVFCLNLLSALATVVIFSPSKAYYLFHFNSLVHVLVLNLIVVAICVLFAIFMPKIGHIISFVGAFCGLSYGIALPCLVYLIASHQQGTLTKVKLIFHCFLIAIGLANFIAQFLIIGHTK